MKIDGIIWRLGTNSKGTKLSFKVGLESGTWKVGVQLSG